MEIAETPLAILDIGFDQITALTRLEMTEIAKVLQSSDVQFRDENLGWDDSVFARYRWSVDEILAAGGTPVLVEIREIPDSYLNRVEVIDRGQELSDEVHR